MSLYNVITLYRPHYNVHEMMSKQYDCLAPPHSQVRQLNVSASALGPQAAAHISALAQRLLPDVHLCPQASKLLQEREA